MNSRRNKQRVEARAHGFQIFCIFLGLAVAALGGVWHVYLKNRQIQTNREIDATERRIEEYRLDIRTCEMRMDQLLNRFVMRKQLETFQSVLRPIPLSAVEEIDATRPQVRAVANAAN
ncbi:MAG: hypothetical protein V4733_02275 [Verrucomicrobiota bacterium]